MKKTQTSRSRLFYQPTNRLLIITNLKVGYSVLNRDLPEDFERLPNDPAAARSVIERYDVSRTMFLLRNPAERFMSFYHHWFINNPIVGEPPKLNRHFELLESVSPPSFFDWFCGLSIQERKQPEVIQAYCTYFPLLFLRDGHTAHQTRILRQLDIELSDISDFVEISQMSEYFERELGISIGQGNKSGRPGDVPGFVHSLCKIVYAIDYDLIDEVPEKPQAL